jgi:hypothetical protein
MIVQEHVDYIVIIVKVKLKKYKLKLVDYLSENNPYLSYDDRNKNLYKKSMKTKSKLFYQKIIHIYHMMIEIKIYIKNQ